VGGSLTMNTTCPTLLSSAAFKVLVVTFNLDGKHHYLAMWPTYSLIHFWCIREPIHTWTKMWTSLGDNYSMYHILQSLIYKKWGRVLITIKIIINSYVQYFWSLILIINWQ
jgi:hypothetical protein